LSIKWLPRALKDRDAQLDFIAGDNPQAAIDQGDRIEHQVNMLADYPDMGRSGRKRGTRELVVNQTPFIVVYRVRPGAQRVEILRVLHGARQWPPLAKPASVEA
jgi:toxin ParE1/3/4